MELTPVTSGFKMHQPFIADTAVVEVELNNLALLIPPNPTQFLQRGNVSRRLTIIGRRRTSLTSNDPHQGVPQSIGCVQVATESRTSMLQGSYPRLGDSQRSISLTV